MRSFVIAFALIASTLISGPLTACEGGPFARLREAREARQQARGNQSCQSAARAFATAPVPTCATCPQQTASYAVPTPVVVRVANPPVYSTVIRSGGDCPNGQCPNARR